MGEGARLKRTLLKRVAAFVPLAIAMAASAQPGARIARIGYVLPTAATWAEATLSPTIQAFLLGMRDHGYVEGRDFVMETRPAFGNPQRLAELTSQLVRRDVDLLLVPVCGAPLKAALRPFALADFRSEHGLTRETPGSWRRRKATTAIDATAKTRIEAR